ncbi:hypothetical protein EDB81DRAFT_441949 [Dactylonectria macrodidyma]|uniref:Transmembrane protein n=1 Tax=Dactylonectria macrodidyma TaxID=307937 RepID=A0A9P9F553_9HYPO|nr:hypothetical protein EDB81DRAFT_441949 [Dactylonectria macrodidyma]
MGGRRSAAPGFCCLMPPPCILAPLRRFEMPLPSADRAHGKSWTRRQDRQPFGYFISSLSFPVRPQLSLSLGADGRCCACTRTRCTQVGRPSSIHSSRGLDFGNVGSRLVRFRKSRPGREVHWLTGTWSFGSVGYLFSCLLASLYLFCLILRAHLSSKNLVETIKTLPQSLHPQISFFFAFFALSALLSHRAAGVLGCFFISRYRGLLSQ